jgi:FkbM family methyltransferase
MVAVEPQSSCFRELQGRFGNDPGIRPVNKAVGRAAGRATIHASPDHVLSSLSESFIERTRASGRFAASSWNQTETVEMTTLDQLIAEHGEPKFIKIDVEGYESEALAGLSQAVPALSIEWTPSFPKTQGPASAVSRSWAITNTT